MSISRRLVACALALAAISPTIAACGGDDDSDAAADGYRTQLRDICAETRRDFAKVEPLREATPAKVRAYLKPLLAAVKDQHRKLAELSPPSDMRGAHDKLVEVNAESERVLAEVAAKIEDGMSKAQLEAVSEPLAGAEAKARDDRTRVALKDLGVPQCAQGQ